MVDESDIRIVLHGFRYTYRRGQDSKSSSPTASGLRGRPQCLDTVSKGSCIGPDTNKKPMPIKIQTTIFLRN